jgi:hypothetical protein
MYQCAVRLVKGSKNGWIFWKNRPFCYCTRCDPCCTLEDECKWFVIGIWFIILKQTINVRCLIVFTLDTITIYIQNNDHSQYYVLCAWWVFDNTSDSSCCLPDCPMGVSSPPLLLKTAYLAPHLVDQAPPRPLPWVDPISLRVHVFTYSPDQYSYIGTKMSQQSWTKNMWKYHRLWDEILQWVSL